GGDIEVDGNSTGHGNAILVTRQAAISNTGAGQLIFDAAQDFFMDIGATVTAENGDISVRANQRQTPAAGNFYALVIENATIHTTGAGNITLSGTAGGGAGNTAGVFLYGAQVTTANSLAGSIAITGTGGNGTSIVNQGVFLGGGTQ